MTDTVLSKRKPVATNVFLNESAQKCYISLGLNQHGTRMISLLCTSSSIKQSIISDETMQCATSTKCLNREMSTLLCRKVIEIIRLRHPLRGH